MRDFLDGLEGELRMVAVAGRAGTLGRIPTDARAASPTRRSWQRHRSAAVTAFAGLATVATTTVVLTTSSAAGLPILSTTSSDASSIASSTALPRSSTDFRHAHAFDTPYGPGYVLTSRDGRQLCITAPDDATPGRYGSACSPLAQAEQRGVALEMVGDLAADPKATNFVTFILPEHAENARLKQDGRGAPAEGQDGVIVAVLVRSAVLSYRLRNRTVRVAFRGPFKSLGVTCPGGVRPYPKPPEPGEPRPTRPTPSCP